MDRLCVIVPFHADYSQVEQVAAVVSAAGEAIGASPPAKAPLPVDADPAAEHRPVCTLLTCLWHFVSPCFPPTVFRGCVLQ